MALVLFSSIVSFLVNTLDYKQFIMDCDDIFFVKGILMCLEFLKLNKIEVLLPYRLPPVQRTADYRFLIAF